MLPINVRAPILARSANSALKNSRKIKASQMVLGIPSNEPFQDMARRSQLLGIKRASDGSSTSSGATHRRANADEKFRKTEN